MKGKGWVIINKDNGMVWPYVYDTKREALKESDKNQYIARIIYKVK